MAGKPVVALDIDGTLGKYHEHFRDFAEQWTGRAMPSVATMSPDCPFYKHLGMSKITYRQCKLAFRQGGMKRSMPVFPGAVEMTRDFRKAGAEIWMCTTRPFLALDNIEPDTRHWLRRNMIPYDGLLSGPHKYNDLVKAVGLPRIIAVLEDEPEQCANAESLGLPVFMHDQPYNEGSDYPRVMDYIHDDWRNIILGEIRRKKNA